MQGWLEAFAAHPKIGDIEGLQKKYGGFAAMSKNEQAGAAQASTEDIQVYNTIHMHLHNDMGYLNLSKPALPGSTHL